MRNHLELKGKVRIKSIKSLILKYITGHNDTMSQAFASRAVDPRSVLGRVTPKTSKDKRVVISSLGGQH